MGLEGAAASARDNGDCLAAGDKERWWIKKYGGTAAAGCGDNNNTHYGKHVDKPSAPGRRLQEASQGRTPVLYIFFFFCCVSLLWKVCHICQPSSPDSSGGTHGARLHTLMCLCWAVDINQPATCSLFSPSFLLGSKKKKKCWSLIFSSLQLRFQEVKRCLVLSFLLFDCV